MTQSTFDLDHSGSSEPDKSHGGVQRRKIILISVVVIIVIAIALGVGLGVGLKSSDTKITDIPSTPTTPPITPPTSSPPPEGSARIDCYPEATWGEANVTRGDCEARGCCFTPPPPEASS